MTMIEFVIATETGLHLLRPGEHDPVPTSIDELRVALAGSDLRLGPGRGRKGGRISRRLRRGEPDGRDQQPAPAGRLVPVLPVFFPVVDGELHTWDPDSRALVHFPLGSLEQLMGLLSPASGAVDDRRPALTPAVAQQLTDLSLTRVERPDRTTPADLPSTYLSEAAEPAAVIHSLPASTEDHGDSADIGDDRVPVHSVFHTGNDDPCLALGMVTAYARIYCDGLLAKRYAINQPVSNLDPLLRQAAGDDRPRILLLSDYMWSVTKNLRVGAEFKQVSPRSLTIHGGPSAPKYESDCEAFFRDHPAVDIVVRGEGEITLAETLQALDGRTDPAALEALSEVAGLTYRRTTANGYELVRTPDRDRVEELDSLPSPYLTGEFDELANNAQYLATVETNRGCPYGCTFCDWGSATNSRIRKFSLERVKGELEWVARHGVQSVFIADANFGIFERDVEIARHIVDLFHAYGSPSVFVGSFAKNTTRHTAQIIRILNEGGVRTDAAPALQTTDETTLKVIRRKNLPTADFDRLAVEFRELQLPLLTDIMIGLPGATVESFKKDLDYCTEHETTIRFCETFILPNSPMNDPAYRAEHAIRTSTDGRLIETASYSTTDYLEMLALRKVYRMSEHFGLLRHAMRFVMWDYGMPASDQLQQILRVTREAPSDYPYLTAVVGVFDLHAAEPGSWSLFYNDAERFYRDQLGVRPDRALKSVIDAQRALVPSRFHTYPLDVELDHDLLAYEVDKRSRPAPRRLDSYGPAVLRVHDPTDLRWNAPRTFELDVNADGVPRREENSGNAGFYDRFDWELESPFKRVLHTQEPPTADSSEASHERTLITNTTGRC